MNTLFNLVVMVQVLSALSIIALVLMQHGKGADMGAAFGSGASGSLFGATGSSNFMSKSTAVAAAIFFATTLALAYMGSQQGAPSTGGGIMERAAQMKQSVPAGTPTASAPATSVVSAAAGSATSAAPAAASASAPASVAASASASSTPSGQIPR